MKTFKEYSDSFIITCNPEMVDFGAKGLEYCIYESSSPLLTPCGNVFSHPSEAVIRLLVTDLQLFNDLPLQVLSSPVIYSYLKDAFTIDDDPFLHQWKNMLASVSSVHKPVQEKLVSVLINEGESDSIEFKSTIRWDIRAGKTNPAIERACMKTISAFLNSIGGNLLIGVRDDGSIEGIETDKFANED